MISAVTGTLQEVGEDRVQLAVGPLVLELLVPASEVELLRLSVGVEITFHTLMYFEGDSSGGNSEPRLLGFSRTEDKGFFQKFITVKGIGPRKALKALVSPSGEIAAAIEGKDAKRLSQLPGIGKRTAEQVIAELSGKVQAFVTYGGQGRGAMNGAPQVRPGPVRTPEEEDAILSLLALGERRNEAEVLLDRAKAAEPKLKSTNEFVRIMLQLRGSRV